MSLTALNAVAFYHYQAICRGHEGLGVHAISTQDATGVMKEGVLDHFLRSVMQFLLFDDYRYALRSCSPVMKQVVYLIQSSKTPIFRVHPLDTISSCKPTSPTSYSL